MITTRGPAPAACGRPAARAGAASQSGRAAARAAAPAPPSTARLDTPLGPPGPAGSASASAASSMPQPVRRAYAAACCACRSARRAGEEPQTMRPPAARLAVGTLPAGSGDGEGPEFGGHPPPVAVRIAGGVVGDDRLDRAAVGLGELGPAELGEFEPLVLLVRRARVCDRRQDGGA